MFGPFERAVAGRYLRARRGERFVSVIAGFSLVGIALGVATLIIVMSVMGGFQVDLLNRILGFNGHLGVYPSGSAMTDYAAVTDRIRKVPGVVYCRAQWWTAKCCCRDPAGRTPAAWCAAWCPATSAA